MNSKIIKWFFACVDLLSLLHRFWLFSTKGFCRIFFKEIFIKKIEEMLLRDLAKQCRGKKNPIASCAMSVVLDRKD
jgi:hypothetical protein